MKIWAESNAEMILKKILNDPESLVIEDSVCKKGKKGWICKVYYRAKNGFGGYVKESIDVILRYDIDEKRYILDDAY